MKKIFAITALFTLFTMGNIEAATVGVGAVIGSPTGFSLNLFTQANQSIQTVAAWDLDDDDEFILFSHYTWRKHDFSNKNAGWFYGIGGRLELQDENDHKNNSEDDDFEIGPSGTIGLLYDFKPIEVFVKGNGTINIIEETDFVADLMLGIHYNF